MATKLFEWFKLNLRKILMLVKSRVFIGFILKNQSMLEVPLNQNQKIFQEFLYFLAYLSF
nr:hypothetical protein HPHPH23_0148 [Helicobacter pylori Hp H-23]